MHVAIPDPLSFIYYPSSDGKPMADNTKQARWIFVLFGNLSALFHARADVFVAADLLWYPLQGRADVSCAPDVLVAFGRPKGDRPSYRQWEEADVPVTVAFEILSPTNSVQEMIDKQIFYEEHGVEEYYIYNPEADSLTAYLRQGSVFLRAKTSGGFVSPRLGVRFDLSGPEMQVYYPDGAPFLTFEQLKTALQQSEQQRAEAARERDEARQLASKAEQRAATAEERAVTAEGRAARLTELTRKVLAQQATAEELQELQRLLGPA